jgi:hypothetical protein
MVCAETLRRRREEILTALAALEKVRRGSVVEQYVERRRADGSVVRGGPYPLYSFKEKGKTVSRRLTSAAEAAQYREQIEGFRRFQDLVAELVRIGEQLCELSDEGDGAQKEAPSSRQRGTRRSSAS